MKPIRQPRTNKDLGVVFTPERITRFLARWAIRSDYDVIIDPGAGSGHFLLAAADRLAELGAAPDQAAEQLYAVEYDEERFRELEAEARGLPGRKPPPVAFYPALFSESL